MPIAPSPAVLRAGDVLAELARYPGESFSVSELARRVGVPRATCDAILQALAQHRLVTRGDHDLRYELGPGTVSLGESARLANPTLRAARVEAERLARELGSSVAVCVRDGNAAWVAEVFDFGPIFARRTRVGQTIPLVPPFGAVFVAWSDADADGWLARADATLTPGERARYTHALHEVRRRGFSLSFAIQPRAGLAEAVETLASTPASDAARRSREALMREMLHSDYLADDFDVGTSVRVGQISAPIFDASGRVTTSLLMPGPEHEITGDELRALADRIKAAARRATRDAGGGRPEQREASGGATSRRNAGRMR
jgi:DNA-binding IclR family transcriptional regulator